MKTTMLLILFCNFCFSQIPEAFKISENAISWQHVYNSDLSQEEIKSQLLADPVLNPLAANFTGQTNPKKLDCKASKAIYFNAQLFYFARIQFKEGKYMVEVSNFQLNPNYSVNLYGVESSKIPEALEDFVLKSNSQEFKAGKLHQNALECLDKFLLDKFAFQDKKTAVDW